MIHKCCFDDALLGYLLGGLVVVSFFSPKIILPIFYFFTIMYIAIHVYT